MPRLPAADPDRLALPIVRGRLRGGVRATSLEGGPLRLPAGASGVGAGCRRRRCRLCSLRFGDHRPVRPRSSAGRQAASEPPGLQSVRGWTMTDCRVLACSLARKLIPVAAWGPAAQSGIEWEAHRTYHLELDRSCPRPRPAADCCRTSGACPGLLRSRRAAGCPFGQRPNRGASWNRCAAPRELDGRGSSRIQLALDPQAMTMIARGTHLAPYADFVPSLRRPPQATRAKAAAAERQTSTRGHGHRTAWPGRQATP